MAQQNWEIKIIVRIIGVKPIDRHNQKLKQLDNLTRFKVTNRISNRIQSTLCTQSIMTSAKLFSLTNTLLTVRVLHVLRSWRFIIQKLIYCVRILFLFVSLPANCSNDILSDL